MNQIMDNVGISYYGGESLHLDGIHLQNDDEDLEKEEEEDTRRQNEEIHNLLQNEFDDLSDDSFSERSGSYNESDNHDGIESNEHHILHSNTPSNPPWSDHSSDSSELFQNFNLNNKKDKTSELMQNNFSDERSKRLDFIAERTSYDQLKLLYEARGQELDESEKEIIFAKNKIRELTLNVQQVTEEKKTHLAECHQLRNLLQENEDRNKSLIKENKNFETTIFNYEREISTLKMKLESADAVVQNLEIKISELQASDCLAKSRQMHDDFIKKLSTNHASELENFKSKLHNAHTKIDNLIFEKQNVELQLKNLYQNTHREMQKKNDIIKTLSVTVDELKEQQSLLLQKNNENEIFEFRELNKKQELDIKNLEEKLDRAQHQLINYETALKFDVLSSELLTEDSVEQLGLKRILNFDESSTEQNNYKNNSERKNNDIVDHIEGLKTSFKQCLIVNKHLRHENAVLMERKTELEKQGIKLQSSLKSNCVELKEKELLIEEQRNQIKSFEGLTRANVKIHRGTQCNNTEEFNYEYYSEFNQIIDTYRKTVKELRLEKQNLLAKHDKEIEELQKKFADFKTAKDGKASLNAYRNQIAELQEVNCKQSEEHEVVVKKLTSLVEILEGDLSEEKSKREIEIISFQKIINELAQEKNSLQLECSKLNCHKNSFEKKMYSFKEKYSRLLEKFRRYVEESKNVVSHYSNELDRVDKENIENRDAFVKKIQVSFLKLKEKCSRGLAKLVHIIQEQLHDKHTLAMNSILSPLFTLKAGIEGYKLEIV